MSSLLDMAEKFFEACETGQGWEVCKHYCNPEATFTGQAESLSGINSLQTYTEWMKGFFTPVPDGHYELRAFAWDEARNKAVAYATFLGTHTGEGGPVPPTGKQAESDYVYVMEFEGGCIRHMTKIWNDGYAMKQLGWA
jgi:predicted ester cyclase